MIPIGEDLDVGNREAGRAFGFGSMLIVNLVLAALSVVIFSLTRGRVIAFALVLNLGCAAYALSKWFKMRRESSQPPPPLNRI